MTWGELRDLFVQRLTAVMEPEDAQSVAYRLIEDWSGLKRMDVQIKFREVVDHVLEARFLAALPRLESHEPVQYVSGYAPFYGRDFQVAPGVLIPRPETEELVQWLLQTIKPAGEGTLLDLCTGSGCIPSTFSLERPRWEVQAVDLSECALEIARENSSSLGAKVDYHLGDVLSPDSTATWMNKSYDVITCNPPYIPSQEKESLHPRVKLHEPAMALFVPDEDPLLFYKAVRELAVDILKPGGWLFLEIHSRFAESTLRLFQSPPFKTAEWREDLSGHERMIRVRA